MALVFLLSKTAQPQTMVLLVTISDCGTADRSGNRFISLANYGTADHVPMNLALLKWPVIVKFSLELM